MKYTERLVEDSRAALLLGQSSAFVSGSLREADARDAAAVIAAEPTKDAFHLLMALRRDAPDIYATIPEVNRAEVLTAALQQFPELNDFGWIEPGGSHVGPAASAILELDGAARTTLQTLLTDRNPADLAGSEEATMAKLYRYRRCDYARWLLAALDGEAFDFAATPEERDR